MSLVINHNLMAANVARNLNHHYGNLATSTQRLSTGLRVNSAADDAAGLAIRELMRTDVAALHQGIRNANDAISMLQTADGALSIIDEKLIRMKELAEQASTGTYDSTQRLMIQSEFAAMGAEIDRIANATDFNGIILLNCTAQTPYKKNEELKNKISTNKTETNIYFKESNKQAQPIDGYSLTNLEWSEEEKNSKIDTEIKIQKEEIGDEFSILTLNKLTKEECIKTHINETKYTVTESRLSYSAVFDYYNAEAFRNNYIPDNDSLIITQNLLLNYDGPWISRSQGMNENETSVGIQIFSRFTNDFLLIKDLSASSDEIIGKSNFTKYYLLADIDGNNEYDIAHAFWYNSSLTPVLRRRYNPSGSTNEFLASFRYTKSEREYDLPAEYKSSYEESENIKINTDKIVKIHFGTGNNLGEDYYYINKSNATLNGLGLSNTTIDTQDNAQKSMSKINNAIVEKDKIRAYYGAMQNRLENTKSNLTIQAENLQASEFRISDVDVATEMTQFVRNQILTQSAVAVLSQANSLPQMVMQLIGG